jgi:hypothetical protein
LDSFSTSYILDANKSASHDYCVDPGKNFIEPPPYSQLTPKLLRLPACMMDNKSMGEESNLHSDEEAGEISVEPPCFFPLTPYLHTEFQAQVLDQQRLDPLPLITIASHVTRDITTV